MNYCVIFRFLCMLVYVFIKSLECKNIYYTYLFYIITDKLSFLPFYNNLSHKLLLVC
jgi:hypothetical protein